MCGIAGIVSVSTVDHSLHLQRMLDTIIHRGPDDLGIHQSHGATIGMRRLSIIDLAGGHQPISNEDGSVWVVNNGEIYNYRRLRAVLVGLGHRFRTESDTEVLVHAYEEYGDDFLKHIDGMFAMAIWDKKRRRLLMARDRLGIKPLYFHMGHGGELAFGSEIKAVLASGLLAPALDQESLQDYLALGYAVAPRTIFKGVEKLAPGQFLVWEQGRVLRQRYWRLADDVIAGRSEDHWSELVRAELQRAIDDHKVSDVPIGAFLSGGIDSSAVVALMAKDRGDPVNTYAIGYHGDAVARYYNELPYARQVAEHYRTRHREIPVQPDVAALLPKLMWHLEEPISDTSPLTTFLVSELAADSVKVILSGVGGDELFGGYTRHLGHFYGQRYRKLPAWLRSGVIEPAAELLPSGRSSRLSDLARYTKHFVRGSRLPWGSQYHSFLRLAEAETLDALQSSSLHGPDGFQTVVDGVTATDPLLRLAQVDLQTQLPEALLLLSDKMTMATSLECRVPFLDHHLVELAASIPTETKIRGGHLKHLLKRSVKDVLPPDVIRRRKRGFGAPMGAWLQQQLKPLRNELLSQRTIEHRGILRWPAVEAVCRAHDERREDHTDLLMVLMNLEIWNRLFVDGSTHADLAGDLSERVKAA